jgi:hypothetical protein
MVIPIVIHVNSQEVAILEYDETGIPGFPNDVCYT